MQEGDSPPWRVAMDCAVCIHFHVHCTLREPRRSPTCSPKYLLARSNRARSFFHPRSLVDWYCRMGGVRTQMFDLQCTWPGVFVAFLVAVRLFVSYCWSRAKERRTPAGRNEATRLRIRLDQYVRVSGGHTVFQPECRPLVFGQRPDEICWRGSEHVHCTCGSSLSASR